MGALEKELVDLKDYRKVLDKRVEGNESIISELTQDLADTKKVIERFEQLAAEKAVESSQVDIEEVEAAHSLKLENDVRKTRKLTKELKNFLREYINKVGTQVP